MSSFVELSKQLSQQHLGPGTSHPTLGLTAEKRLHRLKILKTTLLQTLFRELNGPLQDNPHIKAENEPLTVWDRLHVHCADIQLQGKYQDAEQLDGALQKLAAICTDSRHTADIQSVLIILEKLTGCGHLLPKPSLGHAKYPMKMIEIADEKRLKNTSAKLFPLVTREDNTKETETYVQYSRSLLLGRHCATIDDHSTSIFSEIDVKILEAEPGSSLHGLFNPKLGLECLSHRCTSGAPKYVYLSLEVVSNCECWLQPTSAHHLSYIHDSLCINVYRQAFFKE